MSALYIILALIVVIAVVSASIWALISYVKPSFTTVEKILLIATILSFCLFIYGLYNHTTPYYNFIDPFVEPCYSPISYSNSFLLITLHVLALLSMAILYLKEYNLPPILIVVFIIFLVAGIGVNAQFLFQISSHDTSRIYLWADGDYASIYLAIYPILLIVNSIYIIVLFIQKKANLNRDVKYTHKWLNTINTYLVKVNNLPVFAILLSIPILLFFVIILVLFGQDIEALKVYTETATWRLSEHIHPPTVDDKHGHYLCTVAALGSPNLVKPLAIGRRNNQPIIVNRQLQIANTFEYMIENISPSLHRIIRENYDRYGLNLSKRIHSERLSNLTYILMKPLEWFFLISLYIFYVNPEKIIKCQYKMPSN